MIDKFDSNFSLDVDTQSYGFVTRLGPKRVFFKDASGNLQAILIDGNSIFIDAQFKNRN